MDYRYYECVRPFPNIPVYKQGITGRVQEIVSPPYYERKEPDFAIRIVPERTLLFNLTFRIFHPMTPSLPLFFSTNMSHPFGRFTELLHSFLRGDTYNYQNINKHEVSFENPTLRIYKTLKPLKVIMRSGMHMNLESKIGFLKEYDFKDAVMVGHVIREEELILFKDPVGLIEHITNVPLSIHVFSHFIRGLPMRNVLIGASFHPRTDTLEFKEKEKYKAYIMQQMPFPIDGVYPTLEIFPDPYLQLATLKAFVEEHNKEASTLAMYMTVAVEYYKFNIHWYKRVQNDIKVIAILSGHVGENSISIIGMHAVKHVQFEAEREVGSWIAQLFHSNRKISFLPRWTLSFLPYHVNAKRMGEDSIYIETQQLKRLIYNRFTRDDLFLIE